MIELQKPETIVEILYLIDSSGSMAALRDDVIGGFNSFLKEQQELPGKANLTLVSFDTTAKIVINRVRLADVKPLTRDNYVTRGGTALLDAIGTTIFRADGGYIFDNVSLSTQPYKTKRIMVIVTDGQENASCTYSKAQIQSMIRQRTEEGWDFLYFGANQDSFAEAAQYNISAQNTHNYDFTPGGIRYASSTASATLGSIRGAL